MQEEIFRNPNLSMEVALHLDYESLLDYCRSFKDAAALCRNRYFWQLKAQQDFGMSATDFNDTFLTPAQRYVQVLTEQGGVVPGSEQYIPVRTFIQRAIHADRDDLVDYLISLGYNDYHTICKYYTEINRIAKVIQFSCWRYRDLITSAIKTRDLELVQYFLSEISLSKLTDPTVLDLIYTACLSGDLRIVQYLVELFKDRPVIADNWVGMLDLALQSGSLPLYQYLVSHKPADLTINWNRIYAFSFASGNPEFIDVILKDHPSIIRSPNNELRFAIHSGNWELVDQVIQYWKIDPTTINLITTRVNPKTWPIIKHLLTFQSPSESTYRSLLSWRDFPDEILQTIPDSILRQWPTDVYKDLFSQLMMHKSPWVMYQFLKRLKNAKVVPDLNWSDVLFFLLHLKDKQALDLVFSMATGYNWHWDQIFNRAEKLSSPALMDYLLQMKDRL